MAGGIDPATGAASYAELLARSHFSFLRGASSPAELVERAHAIGGYAAIGVCDLNGVYGIPKAYRALKEIRKTDPTTPLKLIVGAEVTLTDHAPIALLARNRAGYGLLCRLLTAAHAGKPKGEAHLSLQEFLAHLSGSHPGAGELIALPRDGFADDTPPVEYGTLRDVFTPERLAIPLSRHFDGGETLRTRRALEAARSHGLRLLATNDVHAHSRERRRVQDVFTALREGVALPRAGKKLFPNAERHLKSPLEMQRLFRDLPDAIACGLDLASQCTFEVSELRYRYPSEWIPAGETAQGFLTRLTWEGAARRYPGGIPPAVRKQLEHELRIIEELHFADYFLTLWEIVDFARSRAILCQGRGSAANSAVCYCLGITAIDPVRMNLLFERFISAERGEPPDIDVDFEHERREEVIQHIYEKYGRDRAGMVSAIITYRSKLARREVTKALDLPLESNHPLVEQITTEIEGFPRHLSIHSGGFTLSQDPIIETVPIEPARMEGRTIVQWDKEDLETVGLLKVDILALGMLSCLRKSIALVNTKLERRGALPATGPVTLATIPAEDRATYAMVQRADTVGTFQIESRAQMSMLPRLLPRTFYDLVVQIAIVRPGPIQGGMVHPYLRRRQGLEPPDLPDPRLEPILGKTLGVPLFQEQVMKIAVMLGGFTPGEADHLRRAIGAWRSQGSITKMGMKLMEGLRANGIPAEFAERIFLQIQGFAQYGFPESHAASFALLAYASCWLKCHHPGEFACALVNSQPMGFYSVHTILDDARRHGVKILPVHPELSGWDCTMTASDELQLGFRVVQGIRETHVRAMVDERSKRPFVSLRDFLARTEFPPPVLHTLAMGDAFRCFGYDQRHALWEILGFEFAEREALSSRPGTQLPLRWSVPATPALAEKLRHLRLLPSGDQLSLFDSLTPAESIHADYRSFSTSTRGHPMQALRAKLGPLLPRVTAHEFRHGVGAGSPRELRGGRARVCGMVIILQRPPTAKGVAFITLEDETGFIDVVIHQETYEKYRATLRGQTFLLIEGRVQRNGAVCSLLAEKAEPIPLWDFDESARSGANA